MLIFQFPNFSSAMSELEVSDLERELLQKDDSEDEGDLITPQCLLEVLEKAWLNEKFAPEILPHKSDYVDNMLEQIKVMERNISFLQNTDLRAEIHKFELERIRYIVTSYLRCRLKKIEQYAFHIIEQENTREPEERYLTDTELKFAVEYVQNMDSHFDSVLSEMPLHLQTLEASSKRIKPNMNSYVFLRANKTVSSVILRDVFENRDEEVELDENSQHLLPYKSIEHYVKDESVQLI